MVRLIVYNIEYCEGIKGRKFEYLNFWRVLKSKPKLDENLIEFIKTKDPDIVALVEVDCGSPRTKHKDEAAFIEKRLKFSSLEESPQYSFTGKKRAWYYVPYMRKQSNALISRFSLKDIKHHFLSKGTKNVVIEASVDCPERITLLLTHLALGKRARKKQIEELMDIVNHIENPVILMGDFNTLRGEKELRSLIAGTHLYDAVPLDGHESIFTFPTWHPKKRLDYVLVSKSINVKKYSVLKADFSDHLPLLIDFEVKR